MKLGALTAELGLTTGSFYHHFDGMAAFLDELARFYGADQVVAILAGIETEDPVERLRNLVRVSREDSRAALDVAMRDWAGSNDLAASAVRGADEQLLRFVERAFRDLGHDRAAARVRALTLVSVGVARVIPPWRLPRTTAEQILEILTCPTPSACRRLRPR